MSIFLGFLHCWPLDYSANCIAMAQPNRLIGLLCVGKLYLNEEITVFVAVSYTHLTLPTNREV